jgi:SAM-dependent methyltransferase
MVLRREPKRRHSLKETLNGVAKLYSQSLDTHGLTSKSVGWKDEASHRLRFEKLIQVIKPNRRGENITVNDFGCGYGAMFSYLDEVLGCDLVKYYGYDVSEEMIMAARRYISDPRAQFIESPKVTRIADYSFISGTFNVKLKASDEIWTEYVKEILMNVAEMSKKGFSFNALSIYVDWKEENLYYADPLLFFDFCKRNISRYVSLLHDYPLFEWTMIIYKEDKCR